MDVFAGVFLHVDARQAHSFRAAIRFDVDVAAGADGQFVLADLITLGQIRIEIVLAREDARTRDFAVGRQTGFDGEFDDSFVQHRQNAGKTSAYRTGILVGIAGRTGSNSRRRFLTLSVAGRGLRDR